MYVCTECGQRYARDGFCGKDGRPLVVSDDPLIGTEIGRYRIVRVIGQGGMGRVYLALQPHIGSRVAVKVLSDQCARDPDLLERFFAEARAVNVINHEHIVSVIDLAQLPDDRPYIVMEYVEGQTLGRATRGGRAPLGGIVQVVTETLSALAAAHEHQIIHRDLKPDNIIVTLKGHAKVLDFGIAKLAPGLQHPMSPRTRTGALLGTPAYMAPEQISGAANVDARTDVYAAGVVLFEAITGAVPFSGATAFDLMRAQLEDAPPSVRERRPEVPEALAQVIARALAKAPADRFQTASAMGEALHAAAAHLPADQLRALSEDRAPISKLTSPSQPAPRPTHSHTPPAFSAVRPPLAAESREPTTNRESAPHAAPRRPWGWIVGAIALAGIAVAVTVVVMSRDPRGEPAAPVAISPAPPALAPTALANAGSAAATTTPPPTAATPPTTAERPAPAKPTPGSARPSAPKTTPPTTTPPTTKPPPTEVAATPPPTVPTGRIRTAEETAREELAAKWNRHRDSIALPGEHPIARRPRVAAAPKYDATNVDYRKLVTNALALGRKELPGAFLVSVRVPVQDGRADLTTGQHNTLTFQLGSTTGVDGDCSLNVDYSSRQVEIYFLDNIFCNPTAIRTPTCSAASVWERAGRPGDGKPHETHSLTFTGTDWDVGPQHIPDNCSARH